jgi:exopolysaccharide biosynthesis polyprenyl glycosylphosphotransferase
MLIQRSNGIQAIQRILEVIVVQAGFWLLYWILGRFEFQGVEVESYVMLSLVTLLGMTVYPRLEPREISGNPMVVSGWVQSHFRSTKQVFCVAVVLFTFIVLWKNEPVSRVFVVAFLLISYALFLVTNRYLPLLLPRLFYSRTFRQPTLLLGPSEKLVAMADWIEDIEVFGFRMESKEVEDLDRMSEGDFQELLKTLNWEIQEKLVYQIILLTLPVRSDRIKALVSFANRMGSRLMMINDLQEKVGHSLVMTSCHGKQMIALRREPLENPITRLVKRGIDILLSLPVVLFVVPVLGTLIWIVQRIQSPGPLMFHQKRSGLNNGEFTILKFRTMHISSADPSIQTTVDDKRVFPMGRILRKYSIDEIPQFLNVLRGEMSLVGPRPHLVMHNDIFSKELDNYNIRHFIRPGITGLAQVRGFRGEVKTREDVEKRINADIYYLENASLGLDLLIIVRTIICILIPPKTAV